MKSGLLIVSFKYFISLPVFLTVSDGSIKISHYICDFIKQMGLCVGAVQSASTFWLGAGINEERVFILFRRTMAAPRL